MGCGHVYVEQEQALRRFLRKQALRGSKGRGMWPRWESAVQLVVSCLLLCPLLWMEHLGDWCVNSAGQKSLRIHPFPSPRSVEVKPGHQRREARWHISSTEGNPVFVPTCLWAVISVSTVTCMLKMWRFTTFYWDWRNICGAVMQCFVSRNTHRLILKPGPEPKAEKHSPLVLQSKTVLQHSVISCLSYSKGVSL